MTKPGKAVAGMRHGAKSRLAGGNVHVTGHGTCMAFTSSVLPRQDGGVPELEGGTSFGGTNAVSLGCGGGREYVPLSRFGND